MNHKIWTEPILYVLRAIGEWGWSRKYMLLFILVCIGGLVNVWYVENRYQLPKSTPVETIKEVVIEKPKQKPIRWSAPCRGYVNDIGVCVVTEDNKESLFGGIKSDSRY